MCERAVSERARRNVESRMRRGFGGGVLNAGDILRMLGSALSGHIAQTPRAKMWGKHGRIILVVAESRKMRECALF